MRAGSELKRLAYRLRERTRSVARRSRRAAKRVRREGALLVVARWLRRLVFLFIGVSLALVLLFRFVNPPTTLLIEAERWRGAVSREWRPLEAISLDLRRAVIAAEDARFCEHRGFDTVEIRRAVGEWRAGGPLRGASTISQQTAKNVFLWPARSFIRKGLEFWFTALIEVFWPKERILEVYLNVAEFGRGVFGAEAGAQSAFGVSADALKLNQAARLASVLPNPKVFQADSGDADRKARAAAIADGARTLKAQGRVDCVGG